MDRTMFQRQTIMTAIPGYLSLALVTVAIGFPIYWMVLISLTDAGAPSVSVLPDFSTMSFASYAGLLNDGLFGKWYLNTAVIAVATTVAALFCSITAAYAIARSRFAGRSTFAMTIIICQLAPGVLIAIPIFTILVSLGLLNTYIGLVAAYLTKALPFCTWMLWGFFRGLPAELEEAALVDGANRLQALVRIVLPLSVPGLVVATMFTFVLAWEEYLLSLMLLTQDSKLTLTVGASRLVSSEMIPWSQLMAFSVLMTIPVALVFGFVQKHMIRGIAGGALKG